jgi:hypothetical protein
MRCARARRRLSEWIDGDLPPAEAGVLSAHVESCPGCAKVAAALRLATSMVGELPRVEATDPVSQAVLTGLEVETRGPGLGFLFRRFGAARPFMVPSLVPAALVLLTVLAAAMALDSGGNPRPGRGGEGWPVLSASGTESNPLFPSAEVGLPHQNEGGHLAADAFLAGPGEGALFVETVVARDGTVAQVTVLHGDAAGSEPLLDALRRQTFEPVWYRGRPVAVSVYRLISRHEVLAAPTIAGS